MKTPPIHERDSLETLILEFFDRNPGEALTANDVRVKFSHIAHRASQVLKDMCDRSLLKREASTDTGRLEYIYTRS